MIDFGHSIIVCPNNDLHNLNIQDMVCDDCGAEGISLSEDEFMEGAV